MRININIPDDLIGQIDARAEKLFLSRSAYVSMTMAKAIQQDIVIEAMPDMLEMMKQLQSSGALGYMKKLDEMSPKEKTAVIKEEKKE